MFRSLFAIVFLLNTLLPSPTYAFMTRRTIDFSGYKWQVKMSEEPVGPGPNMYSDNAKNVWVDSAGRLHLKITNVKGKWSCAEVVSQLSFGFGVYRFYLDSRVDNLDPNVVLGLFTWNDDPAYYNREIDIEFSRWAEKINQNAQFVVQPYTLAENIVRFSQPTALVQSVHSFFWTPTEVVFQSFKGHNPESENPLDKVIEWTYANDVPQAGGENARMNLWLFRGARPTDGRQVEVIIKRFEFIPLQDYAARASLRKSNIAQPVLEDKKEAALPVTPSVVPEVKL